MLIVIHLIAEFDTFHRRPMIEGLADAAKGKTTIWCLEPEFTIYRNGRFKPNSVRQVKENLFVWMPHYWPWESLLMKVGFRKQIENIFWKRIKDKIASKGEVIYTWVNKPRQINRIDRLGEEVVVYECYDDYQENPKEGETEKIAMLEAQLLKVADVTFVTSKPLEEKLRGRTNNVYYIGNGVDASLWQRQYTVPEEIDGVEKPIAVLLGNINERVDIDLLEEVIKQAKDYCFLFIGAVSSIDFDRIKILPNVLWVGPKSRESAAAYLCHSKIGMIPYKTNKFNDSSEVLKLYEYFAAGLPVISTLSAALEIHKDQIIFAKSADEYVAALNYFKNNNSDKLIKQMKATAHEHDWIAIGHKVLNIISKYK